MKNELDALIPQKVLVQVGGEQVEIAPLKVGQLPELMRSLGPVMKDGIASSLADVTDWVVFLGAHGDAVVDAVAVCIRKPRAWVNELEPLELMTLAFAVLEVNKDFFSRQVTPALERLNQTLTRMGLPGLDSVSGSDCGQPS